MKRLSVLLLALISAGCASTPGGKMTQSSRPFDLAIDGEGFFIVATGEGGYLFTRRGDFYVDSNRYLVNADGYHVAPELIIPDTGDVTVTLDGKVLAVSPETRRASPVGQIRVATFANPRRLSRDGIYLMPTDGSGEPVTHTPGSAGAGTIKAGFVEK